jgi:hypothetical protein
MRMREEGLLMRMHGLEGVRKMGLMRSRLDVAFRKEKWIQSGVD